MKATLELEDFVAAARRARDAHGASDGLGARAVEDDSLRAGHRAHDLVGELERVLVDEQVAGAAADDVVDRGYDRGMRMAEQQRAGAEQVVDVLVAAQVANPRAAPARSDHRVLRPRRHAAHRRRQQRASALEQLVLTRVTRFSSEHFLALEKKGTGPFVPFFTHGGRRSG